VSSKGRQRRGALAALCIVVLCLGIVAPAQAALSTGSVLDPRDKVANRTGSQVDVAGLRVAYDDARGSVRIALAMHDRWVGSVADPSTLGGPEGSLEISLGRRDPSGCSAGERQGDLSVEAIFSADQAAGTATVVGQSREIEAREEQATRGPREVTYLIDDPALAGRGFDCVDEIAAEAGLDGERDTVPGFALAVAAAAAAGSPTSPTTPALAPEPSIASPPGAARHAVSALPASRVSIRASQSLRRLLRSGLRLPVSCTTPCHARATLDIDRRLARRLGMPSRLARGSAALVGDGGVGLTMTVRGGAARWQRALLHVRPRITVAVMATAGGEASVIRRRVRLVR